MDKVEILKRTNLFQNLSHINLESLVEICITKKILKNTFLFFEGDQGYYVYVLVSGSIKLFKSAPDDREIIIKVVKPHEIFAEVILFEEDNYPVSAQALKYSSVFMIPKIKFLTLLKNDDFNSNFMSTLMQRMRYLIKQMHYLTLYDVEDRFLIFLKEHYGEKEVIIPSFSKKDIAKAINTTPETISRVLLRLKKEKKLIWENSTITISPETWLTIKRT